MSTKTFWTGSWSPAVTPQEIKVTLDYRLLSRLTDQHTQRRLEISSAYPKLDSSTQVAVTCL